MVSPWTTRVGPTATSQRQHNPGLVPEPHHTSARWHSLSPGSLHRSTTSLHIVSGVTGTSVKCCSLSLRYTVRNICQQRERERDSSCQCPHHRFHFLVTWDSFPRAPVESGVAVWALRERCLHSPWGPWGSGKPVHTNGQTESCSDTVFALCPPNTYIAPRRCQTHPRNRASTEPVRELRGYLCAPMCLHSLSGARPKNVLL